MNIRNKNCHEITRNRNKIELKWLIFVQQFLMKIREKHTDLMWFNRLSTLTKTKKKIFTISWIMVT